VQWRIGPAGGLEGFATRFRRRFAIDPSKLIPQSAQNLAQEVPGAGSWASMLGYLSKFVLQMLPTISATVIGAYIVATWINPKTPPEPAKIAAQQAPKAASHATQPDAATAEATLGAETTATEAAKPVKAAQQGGGSIRVIPIVKQSDALVAVESASVTDERKDVRGDAKGASELARAAIQRLRGSRESQRAAEEPVKPVAAVVRAPQVRPMADASQVMPVTAAPPLPPAVTIAAPRYPQADVAETFAQPERLAPPGEIPAAEGQPLRLRASHRVAESPSFAADVLSATKSFFRAITPQ
jgi:hypothetical protein